MAKDKEKQLEALLDANALTELLTGIRDEYQDTQYAFGPLEKSSETELFEKITAAILQDYESNSKTKKVVFSREGNDFFVATGTQKVNFSKMMQKVNLTHIVLDPSLIERYSRLPELRYDEIEREVTHKSLIEQIEKEEDRQGSKLKEAGFKKIDKDIEAGKINSEEGERLKKEFDLPQEKRKEGTSLTDLEFGEMLAIRNYTSANYTYINALLRGQTQAFASARNRMEDLDPTAIRALILHIAVASSGLNKIHDTEVPSTIRKQNEYGLDKLIQATKAGEVIPEKAFLSTAYKVPTDSVKFPGTVRIVFEKVKGKNIGPISRVPNEEEYLLPPGTQLKWTGYKKVNGLHVFTTEGTNVLLETARSQADLVVDSCEKTLTKLQYFSVLGVKLYKLPIAKDPNFIELLKQTRKIKNDKAMGGAEKLTKLLECTQNIGKKLNIGKNLDKAKEHIQQKPDRSNMKSVGNKRLINYIATAESQITSRLPRSAHVKARLSSKNLQGGRVI